MTVIYIRLSLMAEMFFFALRRRRPFAYGAFEFAVGLIGLTLRIYPQTTYLVTADSSSSGIILSRGIAIVGGIYLLVRGMDNMERDLPALSQTETVPTCRITGVLSGKPLFSEREIPTDR